MNKKRVCEILKSKEKYDVFMIIVLFGFKKLMAIILPKSAL